MLFQFSLELPNVITKIDTTHTKFADYANKMSRCVSWVHGFGIFRVTERNKICLFLYELQTRYDFRTLRAAFVYFLKGTCTSSLRNGIAEGSAASVRCRKQCMQK